jgi:hypothetical protein
LIDIMSAVPTTQAKCERCGATFDVPLVDAIAREKVAALVRDEHLVLAMKALHEKTGAGLANCKGVIYHISRKKGQCHRCKRPLSGEEQTVCNNCKSLNLDW